MTKRCSHCKRNLPIAAFARDRSRPDGLTYWCSACRNASARRRYTPKPTRVLVCSGCGIAKTPKNTAAMASASDGYQTRCRSCKRAYGKAWRLANAALHAARTAQWKRDHPEWERAYQRAWAGLHPDFIREKSTRRRARQAGAYVEEVVRLILLERDDGVCGICGDDVDPLNFHMDHIVPLDSGGEHSYANTQVAHPSCNVRKGTKPAFMSTSPTSPVSTS